MWIEVSCKFLALSVGLSLAVCCLWTISSVAYLATLRHPRMYNESVTPWMEAGKTLFLGSQVAAVAIVASVLTLLPAMIMTWTTLIILSIPNIWLRSFSGKQELPHRSVVEDGIVLARHILVYSWKSAMTNGQLAGLLVVTILTTSIFFWRQE